MDESHRDLVTEIYMIFIYLWFFVVTQYEICFQRSVCRKGCLHFVRTGEKS